MDTNLRKHNFIVLKIKVDKMSTPSQNLALALVAFTLTGAEFSYAGVIKSPMNINKRKRV